MKFCIHCGKAHSEIPKFCSNCGTAWNAPKQDQKQNAITSARKAAKRIEDFDEDDEEDEGPQESVAALLGGAKRAFKAAAVGARVFKGEDIASDPNFFYIEDEREKRALNYDFQKDMAKVRETPKGEIN